MTNEPSDGVEPDGDGIEGWPTRLAGITETVVATRRPEGRWNQAALGISPGKGEPSTVEPGETAGRAATTATARTFGRTRTRRNFEAGRKSYVQFTRDPVDFVEAALGVYETDAPILESADAWTEVRATKRDHSDEHGTEIVEWSLEPLESGVGDRPVSTTNRGRAAAIEATVPASRLDVDTYDEDELLQRLEWLAEVVDAAGDERARAAFERIDELVGWRNRLE